MRLLLDTQVYLWAIYRPARLSPRVASLLNDESNQLVISDASIWEVSLKLSKGKLEYERQLGRLYERISELGAEALPILRTHIEYAVQLPQHHADPFDRLLIAQAALGNLPLLTVDEDIWKYDIQTIWR